MKQLMYQRFQEKIESMIKVQSLRIKDRFFRNFEVEGKSEEKRRDLNKKVKI